jgi:hypothetical protein
MKKILAVLVSSLLFLFNISPSFAAGQATLSLSPVTATQAVDSSFTVEIHVNTAGTAANTIKAYLTFDPNVLQVASVSIVGSVANIFTENEPDNINGTLHITGAATGNGFNGSDGLFATINFSAKAAGTSTLTFTSDSRVISNLDNSDMLNFTGLKNGDYTISASIIPTASGAADASSSALPDSGSYTNTIELLLLAFGLISIGLLVSNPRFIETKWSKKRAEKNILKKL